MIIAIASITPTVLGTSIVGAMVKSHQMHV